MPQDNLLMQEDFETLLSLLASNREEAGAKYEELRKGLMRYFYLKGSSEPETLADETITRASAKISKLITDQNFQLQRYFYAIAVKVFLEYLKKEKKTKVYYSEGRQYNHWQNLDESEYDESKYACLEKCLTKISADEKELVIGYFSKKGGESIAHRRKMAKRFNLKVENLHVRIFRLKKVLRNCVEKCMNE